jgi:hypothetical protein
MPIFEGVLLMFKPATKSQSKARVAVFGPSGAGKTFSSLRIATGLSGGGRIALIDTERGSASKYSDRFAFDVAELTTRTIDGYTQTIREAASAGYPVLCIDSLTHGWHELLAEVERLAQTKFRGNTWSAWSEGTPKQHQLVEAILGYPGHVIATMRSKTEWQTASDDRGRSRPVRVGLAPEQGKGIEYEFDLLLELSTDHIANVIKDRSGKFQDTTIDKPGEDFGKQLAEWLSHGSAPIIAEPQNVAEQLGNMHRLYELIKDRNVSPETQQKWCELFKVPSIDRLSDADVTKIIHRIESAIKAA